MDNWKTILTFTNPLEAHMAKAYLDSEGIDSMIQDEMIVQVNHFYSNAIGGVKIRINKADYEKGFKILQKGGYINEAEKNKKRRIETYYINSKMQKNNCAYCDSENFDKAKELNALSIIGVFYD